MARQFLLIFAIVAMVRVSFGAPYDSVEEDHPTTTTTEAPASIVDYSYEPTDDGFSYSYGTSTGIMREETVGIRNKGTPEEMVVINGKIVFLAEDGFRYTIKYSFDENGRNVKVSRLPWRRIDPNALKSLIG